MGCSNTLKLNRFGLTIHQRDLDGLLTEIKGGEFGQSCSNDFSSACVESIRL